MKIYNLNGFEFMYNRFNRCVYVSRRIYSDKYEDFAPFEISPFIFRYDTFVWYCRKYYIENKLDKIK